MLMWDGENRRTQRCGVTEPGWAANTRLWLAGSVTGLCDPRGYQGGTVPYAVASMSLSH